MYSFNSSFRGMCVMDALLYKAYVLLFKILFLIKII